MVAGALRERVAFDTRTTTDDGYGNVVSSFDEQFVVAAGIRYLRGSEPVLEQRLAGVQPIVVTIRSSTDTRRIEQSWQCRNVRSGAVYNIRAVTPDDRRQFIDLLCEAGVATG